MCPPCGPVGPLPRFRSGAGVIGRSWAMVAPVAGLAQMAGFGIPGASPPRRAPVSRPCTAVGLSCAILCEGPLRSLLKEPLDGIGQNSFSPSGW